MKRISFAFAAIFLTIAADAKFSVAAQGTSILEIERKLHNPRRAEGRQGIFREVLRGKGTDEEKQQLLDLYKALSKTKPPRGSQENWEKSTAALVATAEEIVSGTAKDVEKLRAASNCKACHEAHRGPDPALAADGTRIEEAGSFGKAAPPQFVKLSNISKDKLNITVYYHESKPVMSFREETIEMDGKTRKVQVPVTEMVSEMRQTVISLQYVRLFDSTGKEIKGDDVWKRLKPGVTLLRQTAATEVDPTFLKLLSKDALILAPSVLPGSAAKIVMTRFIFPAAICLYVCAASARTLAAEPDFDRQIAPILASRCLDCHNSSAEKKGGLDLSQVKAAEAGGDSGKVLVAGKLNESLIWERIDKGEMPPKKPLPENERTAIKAWIVAGAKWGTSPIDPYRYTTAARAGYDWWSLQPLVRPDVPRVESKDADWKKKPVDAFVLAKLQARGLTPSPKADRRTLIRRLFFDLIGLPPSPEEVEAFAKDDSPNAYSQLVQTLLDSPHYGERWARHWLDVAHFGESDGFEYDRMRPNAWRYRDWVIESLNRDLPYDEFARLQIAGDVLRPSDPAAVTATGFLVGGAHDSLLPQGDVMKAIMRQDELEDIVAIVGQTFLGVTVNCARCHDHKFDPIKQTDYYRLAAALAGVRRGERSLPPQGAPAELAVRRNELQKLLGAIEEPIRTVILAEREAAAKKKPAPPKPYAHWDFDGDLKDGCGRLHGEAKETARLEKGELLLDGQKGYVVTAPLPTDIKEKTLEAWVRLANLDQKAGGVISIQTLDGNLFDSIVFAEKEPQQWLAGSNGFVRTQSFEGPKEEQAKDQTVHVAIIYSADGTITGYRDGFPYGKPYKSSGLLVFKAKESQIVFGMRHGPPGGNKHLAGAIERANFYDRALTPEEVAASAGVASRHISEEELAGRLEQPKRDQRKKLLAEITDVAQQLSRLSDPKVFACTPQQPAEATSLLIRGNPLTKGEAISAAGLSALKESGNEFGLPPDAPESERRKRMAQWIASAKNPLFARTIVNRVWQYHFGRGLVDTPNDLGFSGGPPSHPELLDWLASELIRQKWSLKELHRTIVMSATWQQTSLPRKEALALDADNRLHWRYSPRRLEAEAIRDAMLTITGQLNPAVGGPSYKDFRPYEHKGAQFYEPQDPVGPEFNRRSVYRMWARGGKNQMLDTFDCPDPSTATPKRGATTTPLQALSLLNNSFTLRMADDLAARVKRDVGEDNTKQVARAIELAYGRPAAESEIAASLPLVEKHGLAPFCRVLLNTNGFLHVN